MAVSNPTLSPDLNPDVINRNLGAQLDPSNLAAEQNTIMGTYQQRQGQARELARSNETAISSNYNDQIKTAEEEGKNAVTTVSERSRNLGLASQSAVIGQEQLNAEKRVRSLTATRDSLLAQNKSEEASRLDSLITGEQQAITQARQSYLSNLFSGAKESRDAMSFETPDQQSARALKTAQQTAIASLAATAPDAGISQADIQNGDLSAIANKYRNSASYKQNIAKGEADLALVRANIAKSQADTAKTNADIRSLGTGTPSPANAKYSGIIDTLLGSGKFTKSDADNMKRAINSGEDPVAVIRNQAKNLLTGANQTKLEGFETARDALTSIENQLTDYYAAGGKTNIFKGNIENVINKLGIVKDPKLVSIATQIKKSIQSYRNSVSGTAYSVQEGVDIESIFPGITSGQGLNAARLAGTKNGILSDIDSLYTQALGQKGYSLIKGQSSSSPRSLGFSLTDNLFGEYYGN